MAERVLCIAAHPDDEVLGCGATLAWHRNKGDAVEVLFCADGVGARETGSNKKEGAQHQINQRLDMAKSALSHLGVSQLSTLDFSDNCLDNMPLLQLIQAIEAVVQRVDPTIIYTHHAGDLNIDHRRVCEAVLTACRPLPDSPVKTLYAFEVVSSTGWGEGALPSFVPTVFVDIEKTLPLKMKALEQYDAEMRAFPHARSYQALQALAAYRGSCVGLPAAEAFVLLRQICKE
ncbi:PIG-L deacetylase family protein [Marinagarivorans cellulosilyticus]|uniref:GlcNAc-PI de-N-acetylase n=1 Tax=Marinagarivorans cellulosilyticus TaxID=2721545 RepID=A0AAN1WKI2_9GAMM|nr:PIG-L family deacetylase [Marinagarivorans cellulosilyticus]BCD99280.1 hypothetical protein MARGE09_P3481 [Marinagarivorans cellulosilyticus]